MNFLCICQYGHSRSVALSRVLQQRGHAAVAIGWMTSGNAIQPLSQWADRICTLETHFRQYVPNEHIGKVLDFNVGPDRWVNPYNQELLGILEAMVNEKLKETA